MKRILIPFGTIAATWILAGLLGLTGCKKQTTSVDSQGKTLAEANPMPWEDPAYKTDIRATTAESRPGPEENGWTEWLKHHEDRKRWCTEKDVDLLMVGDSIVFEWPRVGKSVWDAYYSHRKAVNIGSSGDRTYHMLWHFQNGGLDGMKNRNPKLVVMMIGTNNRGEPEANGEDTAYGILALLKEIHAKLPQSKILLMPVFPRGKTPDDEGRARNEQINKIIQTYADNKTVHWLDIGHVFLDDQGNLKTDLMPDGLHPNPAGYRVWAEAMEPTIRKLLGEPAAELDTEIKLEKNQLKGPDLTGGGSIPEMETHTWLLGATGARGWTYNEKLSTASSRQIGVTEVAQGSHADGVLRKGDVILGVSGKPFSYDARVEFGKALTAAEGADGRLGLIRWRDGAAEQVAIQLPVLGTYSPTAPYDCPKSDTILKETAERLAQRMNEPAYAKQNAISRSLNALGLLATGDPKYLPIIKKEAEWAAAYAEGGYQAWWYGYVTVFLSEYILATGDTSVLPGLRRIAMEAATGQSAVGSWGHRFAAPDGRLYGYGMMNSPGIPLTIGLVLAREAGVDDAEVAKAIERSGNLLRFYVGKGAVPYGDHAPFMQSHEDNGKCGMAAVLFDQMGEEKGAEFFSKMSAASHGSERDMGHTGNFFNLTWAMPGVSRCGPHATGAWMEEFGSWYFDLARAWDGSFSHQGPPQARDDSYGKWDATGVYLLAYAMPHKAVRLTGSKSSSMKALDEAAARQVVRDGRGFTGYGTFTAYDDLPPDALIALLGSWSPIVRARVSGTIARRGDIPVEAIIKLLDDPSVEMRQGACEALAMFRDRAAPAVPRLREILKADDLWLRVKAAEALNAIGKPAMVSVPEMLQMAAKGPTAEDPRGMEQRFLVQALFSTRSGMLGKSLDGVDRELLYQVVRSGLRNEDGHARGALSAVYANLSFDELQPLMPVIHRAILDKSPSGEMFDGQIQYAGLDLFSKHHVSEGIGLIADYTTLMKKHGSNNTLPKLLEMLKRYGAHGQRAIPQLEKAVHYFEHEEQDFPKQLSLQKAELVRQVITELKTLTDKPELRELGIP